MYNYRVKLENIEIITGSELEILRMTCGPIPQHGKRYHPSMPKTAILRSNNAHDLVDAMQNQFWDHTSRLVDIKRGWNVYIIMNSTAVNRMNGVDFAIKAIAKSMMEPVIMGNSKVWTSLITSDSDILLDMAIEAEQAS